MTAHAHYTTVRVTAAVYWTFSLELSRKFRFYPSLLAASTGQASDPILDVAILLSPVFLINSRHPLFCAAFLLWGKKALLIPKLRSQFAEFLQHGFLYRLSLLN